MAKTCRCGSGLYAFWVHDARGIPLCFVCPKCKATILSKYRPEVLVNSNYHVDEAIDED